MSNFPYDGTSSLTPSADPVVTELQQAHLKVERLSLALVRPDSSVQLIAHFDGDLKGHLGQEGSGAGAIRYWDGKFPASKGVAVEPAGTNLVTNPSAEVDLTGWSANDPAITLSRDTTVRYTGNGTVSVASFKLAGTDKAGPGYIQGTASVSDGESYSASVQVRCEEAAKAKLQLSFTGGAAVSYDTGDVTLAAGEWTQLELEDKAANDNTACEVRIYLVQEAPEYQEGSRFSFLTPTATADVTDNAMTILAGDVVMCAVTASPDGPESYSWHEATTAATGVSSSALRLDDEEAQPVFVEGSRFSKWTPDATVLESDSTTTLNEGDLVFCKVEGEGYRWRMVTTAGTAASTTLRLDGQPSKPRFVPGSRLSRFVPTATALVTDAAMDIDAGDIVFCSPIDEPQGTGYGFHMATADATGVSSTALRLDDSECGPPVFASGSRFSKLAPSGTALVTDASLVISTGAFAFCHPTKNPKGTGYGWRFVQTGATGVSSASLRLDQTSSKTIYADCVQVEEGPVPTGYIDSFQGTGFSGSPGSTSSRAASSLTFPTAGILSAAQGTVAFWCRPSWAGNDGEEHVLFDLAVGEMDNRMRLSKDVDDKLVLTVYDDDQGLKQVVSSSAMSFGDKTWQHLAFTWESGTLTLYHNGAQLSTSTVGSGSGHLDEVAAALWLGSDWLGAVQGGALFDDLVVKDDAATADEVAEMARGSHP